MKLIIFDVDGTLVTTKSGDTFRKGADDWQWIPERLERCQELDSQGVKLALATNQGGVAFGYLDPHEIRHELYKTGQAIHAAAVEMCFSHPKATIELWREDSPERKPNPGMLLRIIQDAGEDLSDVLYVGDRDEDEQAAHNAGVTFMWADEFFN